MADESRKESGPESAESLIDDHISEILADAGKSTHVGMRGGPLASLLEVVTASPSRSTSRVSTLERLLLAQTIASALADALAPALAETLTPEIMKALEHRSAGESPSPGEPAVRAGDGTRQPAQK